MPYHIGAKGSHGCSGFPVIKDSDDSVMGCHKTKEQAKKQLAALYIHEPEASKEKAMAMDFTTGYAQIVKYDKNEDGTLSVYGKATDDTLDLDSQICDPKWLDTAMPRWFKTGGNIREMHGPSAAGIAKEYEAKNDGHYINVLVVDPLAAKKVETGVYQGFSIGIKSPRVIQDSKAANGRIIDGQIVEVSLVDRPANPSAKLILAKSVEGETSLVQVEEVIENEPEVTQTEKGSKMETIKQITELAKSLTTVDAAKFDKSLFDNARRALAELIAAEALEMTEGHDERYSLSQLAEAVNALMNWYEGEEHEGEVTEMIEEVNDKAADIPACSDGKCGKCVECMSDKAVEAPDTTQEEESDQAPTTMELNDMVDDSVKSVDSEEPQDSVTEEVTDAAAEETNAEAPSIEEIVEKAVKSAMKSVEAEMVALRADKEAAVTKAVELETELSDALNKAVAGGPKRTATKMSDQSQNDALVKAATFKAKMDATTDPLLYKGYSELRDIELRKAGVLVEDN